VLSQLPITLIQWPMWPGLISDASLPVSLSPAIYYSMAIGGRSKLMVIRGKDRPWLL